jgi:tetratricopeptide (TPR) repeat protein
LRLDVLDIDAAAAFLLERTEGRRRAAPGDNAKAHEIATELGRVVLTLELASACLARHQLTFAQYQDIWWECRDYVLDQFGSAMPRHDLAVAVTWQTTFAHLDRAPSRRLLARLAWLAAEPIPDFLLDVESPGAKGEDLREARDDLIAYGLVTRDAAGPFFRVHPVIQEVTRRNLVDNARHHSFHEALSWINHALPFGMDDDRSWLAAGSLEPHARAVTDHPDIAQFPALASNVMRQLGTLLRAKGRYGEAEQVYRHALASAEKSLEADHPEVAGGLTFLGQLLWDTNRCAEAEPLMRRALALGEKKFGPDRPEIATSLIILAHLLTDSGRSAEAEPLIRRALAIEETNVVPNDRHVANRLSHLAGLLYATQRFAEAEALWRRALDIEETSRGPDHPKVAIELNNLARLLEDTRRLAEAEPLLRRALAILAQTTRRDGFEHPQLRTVLLNYADLLKAVGKSQEEIMAAIEAVIRAPA